MPELEPLFESYEDYMGFVPNSALTMAHRPELLRAFVELTKTVNAAGTVGAGLKALVALVSSQAAGCRYCQAHMAGKAAFQGLGVERQLEAVWDFETSGLFDPAERAALRLARDAAQVPNAVDSRHFDDLREHFDDGDIVEIMAVIALFGFLNRWNDTMATELEELPWEAADRHLAGRGWEAGKHQAAPPGPGA